MTNQIEPEIFPWENIFLIKVTDEICQKLSEKYNFTAYYFGFNNWLWSLKGLKSGR